MCELNGESAHEGLRGEGARKSRETQMMMQVCRLMKEEREEGGLGRKSLRLQSSSGKVLATLTGRLRIQICFWSPTLGRNGLALVPAL